MNNQLQQECRNLNLSGIIYSIIAMQEELSLKEIWLKKRENEIIETEFAKLPKKRQMEILTRRTFDKPFFESNTKDGNKPKFLDPLYELFKNRDQR